MELSPSKSAAETKVDVFRDTYVRYLGYANELGESFRPLMHVNFVRFSYVVASGYVIADSIHKMMRAQQRYAHKHKNGKHSENASANRHILKAGMDSFIWQSFASVIIPGFTINRIVKGSSASISKLKGNVFRHAMVHKCAPTAIGLISIPFIIQPIDNFVHFAMDNTYRSWTKTKKH